MDRRTRGIRPDMPKTLGIQPDEPGKTVGEVLQHAILGPERVDRHKKLMARMDALGMTAAEKVALVADVMKKDPTTLFDVDLQLDRIEYRIEQREAK